MLVPARGLVNYDSTQEGKKVWFEFGMPRITRCLRRLGKYSEKSGDVEEYLSILDIIYAPGQSIHSRQPEHIIPLLAISFTLTSTYWI